LQLDFGKEITQQKKEESSKKLGFEVTVVEREV
jgi:hypothetical protein